MNTFQAFDNTGGIKSLYQPQPQVDMTINPVINAYHHLRQRQIQFCTGWIQRQAQGVNRT